jgi:hypothetical protein
VRVLILCGGAVLCGAQLFKSASEKDKDQRDETAGQVAKKQSKMAKSKIAAIRDSVWKKRWFVLSGGALYYYKDDRDASADPKGFFFLHDAKLQAAAFPESANSWQERLTSKQGLAVPLDGGDDPLALRIQGKSVTLNLKAPSQEERISWGVTIQKHIAYAHYLEGCWAQGRAVPSPHLAQLLLDVTPTDGKSFEHQLAQSTSSGDAVSAVAAVAALGASELNRVVIPAGSALVASASTDLLTELLGGVGGASIQSLKLTRVLMSARGLYQLATQALPALCNLAELDLGYLNLQPEDGANQVPVSHSEPAAQAVAVALSPMAPSLTSLKLDGMPFGTTLAAAALGQALSGLTNLSTLTLADCDLGGVGATACFGARCGATLAIPGFQGQPCNGPMRPTPGAEAAECFCDDCEANGKRTMGTSYTCAGGCDFDLCAGCYGTRCCGRRPCALPPSLTSLDVSRCGLLSVDIGRVGSAALKDALRKASKAPAVVLTPISLSKGPLGFGMKIGMDGTVESFAEDEPCAKDGGIVLGAKIVSVNGIDTADKTAIAEALRSAPDGEPVVFGMQTQAAAEAAKLKPPKPKPPRPSEGVPPAATGGAAGDATVAPTEATWGPVSASLLGAPKLRTLQLQGNEALEDSGAAALAALLLAPRALPGIVELGLAQCGLAEAGLRTVATVMGLANGPKSLCVMDLGGNRLAGSLIQGVGFGREGRGALYQFDELKLRR